MSKLRTEDKVKGVQSRYEIGGDGRRTIVDEVASDGTPLLHENVVSDTARSDPNIDVVAAPFCDSGCVGWKIVGSWLR